MQRRVIQPETLAAPIEKAEVSPVFGRQQPDVRVEVDGRVVVGLERDVGVVFRLDQKRGHADAVEYVLAGLRLVVVIGAFETERRRGNLVVDLVESTGGLEIVPAVTPGRENALSHALEEAALVDAV